MPIKVNGTTIFDESDFANKNLSNVTVNVFHNAFTPLDVLIAEGDANIAGTYTLTDLPNDGKIRFCAFECLLHLDADNISIMALSSDVFTSTSNVCATNNRFTTSSTIWLPVKQKITISFPNMSGGVVSPTYVRFKGYLQ